MKTAWSKRPGGPPRVRVEPEHSHVEAGDVVTVYGQEKRVVVTLGELVEEGVTRGAKWKLFDTWSAHR